VELTVCTVFTVSSTLTSCTIFDRQCGLLLYLDVVRLRDRLVLVLVRYITQRHFVRFTACRTFWNCKHTDELVSCI